MPDDALEGRLVLDVGSSIGEISRSLANRGARMVFLDLSLRSMKRCRQITPEAEIFHGRALERRL